MRIFSVCVLLASVCQALSLSGWIQSPGFPHGYGSDASGTWRRCAPPGHALVLKLLHLDLEESIACENDALTVSADHLLLANLCGRMTLEELHSSVNPLLHSSSGGCLNISFHSDYSNMQRHTGFRAFYTTQDVDECWENDVACSHFCHNFIGGYSCSCKPGYYLDLDQHQCRANCTEERHGAGVLTSPGSPGPYFENADCSVGLTVDEGNQVNLRFSGVFDVESRDGRCVDFVQIKTDTEMFGPFCGTERPSDILTTSQHVNVIFHSDPEGTNQGFTLHYGPKRMECFGKVTPHSVMSPARDRYPVGDSVRVDCVKGYVLHDSTDTFQSMCQLNGKWSPKHTCEPVNCGHPDLPDLIVLNEEKLETSYRHSLSIRCSSEYYSLLGDANFTCDATGEWVTANGQNFSIHAPRCVPVCGVTKQLSSERILGGARSKLGEIPWQLLVKEPDRGGASLINDRWAVTAAHVVEGRPRLVFSGGMIDGRDKDSIKMETEKIVIHPEYKKKAKFNHDIALVKMSARVTLGENIKPVCLPDKKTGGAAMEGKMGTVSGFGQTLKQKKSQYLQYVHVKEHSGVCFDTQENVTENMFCAGGEGVDSCHGDSGGPLFIPMLGFGSPDTPYRLTGIVSWGPPCDISTYKGYYTKVENYLDWIRETINNN